MRSLLVVLAVSMWLFVPASSAQQVSNLPAPAGDCQVTTAPSGRAGSHLISVGLWPEGMVVFKPGGPGFITPAGALGMKFPWQRGISGRLKIDGRRLDADAPPLRSEVPFGYGDRGFQSSYIIFPTPGCWEVTGRVADASVTFITEVVKVGEGPSWRRQ